MRQGNGGVTVTLEAVPRDPHGNSLAGLVWTAGDGSEPKRLLGRLTFVHTYDEQLRTVIVGATGFDDRGGSTTELRDLDLVSCTVQETEDCGCSLMLVAFQGGRWSRRYCTTEKVFEGMRSREGLPEPPGCVREADPPDGACPEDEPVAFQCRLGPFSPADPGDPKFVGSASRFPPFAQPDQRLCSMRRGQLARGSGYRVGTADLGGEREDTTNPESAESPPDGRAYQFIGPRGIRSYQVRENEEQYPAVDEQSGAGIPLFAADDYTVQSEFKKRYSPAGLVHWWDTPRDYVSPAIHAEAVYRMEFVTYLQGSLGFCWCHFAIEHGWSAEAGYRGLGPGGSIARLIDRFNCFLIPP